MEKGGTSTDKRAGAVQTELAAESVTSRTPALCTQLWSTADLTPGAAEAGRIPTLTDPGSEPAGDQVPERQVREGGQAKRCRDLDTRTRRLGARGALQNRAADISFPTEEQLSNNDFKTPKLREIASVSNSNTCSHWIASDGEKNLSNFSEQVPGLLRTLSGREDPPAGPSSRGHGPQSGGLSAAGPRLWPPPPQRP